MTATTESAPDRCGLCDGALRESFVLTVLEKYRVRYRTCERCGSLQTEPAYWLQQAYESNNLALLDTGAAQRNLANVAAAFVVSRLLRMNAVLDYGGGDGLLCRMLRDYTVNCFVDDKYATVTYARAFTRPDFSTPDLLLAFEVFEHFEHPRQELQALFRRAPAAILASTLLYTGQNSDWWYLSPETGQHVFFYTHGALSAIAIEHGYRLAVCGPYILFYRPQSCGALRVVLLKLMLRRVPRTLIGMLLRGWPPRGVWKDFERLRRRSARDAESRTRADAGPKGRV
ncbi:MAG TPA: methyltransferase domain-containing protein [Steroidobacteraceae bacterium]